MSSDPGVVRLARLAEEAGADSVWVSDHICVPKERTSRYPYSPDGAFPFPDDWPWFDSLTVLAAIAAVTEHVGLGTGILVLTQRNPLEVAKVASSIDQISGGRLRLGVGAGWFEEEIRALGYRPESRGRRLDEAIEVMRDCWTGETRPFHGRELSIDGGLVFLPKPAQVTIPILIGGASGPAHRRAARLGDGWIPDMSIDMLDFDELRRTRNQLDERRHQEGRGELPFERVLIVELPSDRAGELPAVAERANELGFDELVVEVPFDDPPQVPRTLAAMRDAAPA
jgi:probable F420-dependent oxidoreductase